MSLFSALRRKPEEDDLYDEYEPNYAYEEDDQGWQDEGVQPIHSVADMQIVLVAPQEYKDASKIADLLRDMKFVVLNLAKTQRDVGFRLWRDLYGRWSYHEGSHQRLCRCSLFCGSTRSPGGKRGSLLLIIVKHKNSRYFVPAVFYAV